MTTMTTTTLKPMLAATITGAEGKSLSDLKYPVYASYKLDGIRCLIVDNKVVSRTLKEIPNEHIRKVLTDRNWSLLGRSFDGELIVGEPNKPDTYTKTASGVMSQSGLPNFTYYIFDCHAEVQRDIPYKERYAQLRYWKQSMNANFYVPSFDRVIQILKQTLCSNPDEVEAFEKQAIELGYEGIMIRQAESLYKMGRSTFNQAYLLKLKRYLEMEGEIIGFQELMLNKNEPEIDALGYQKRSSKKGGKEGGDTLGALILNIKWDGKLRELHVGSGLNDALRKKIWSAQDKYRGRKVTFKYSPPVKEDGLPRQPIFLRFREDNHEN